MAVYTSKNVKAPCFDKFWNFSILGRRKHKKSSYMGDDIICPCSFYWRHIFDVCVHMVCILMLHFNWNMMMWLRGFPAMFLFNSPSHMAVILQGSYEAFFGCTFCWHKLSRVCGWLFARFSAVITKWKNKHLVQIKHYVQNKWNVQIQINPCLLFPFNWVSSPIWLHGKFES